ncbi:MAG: glycosyltransferase [Nanoarchaeota archaeon]
MNKKPSKPLVSVIIPAYNAEKHIEQCLNSLQRQSPLFPFEIIVVDSSTDATPTIIKIKFPKVKLIHRDQQTYPGAGRNRGAKEARGEILAFIDSDCIATENWLEKGVEMVKKGHPIVGGSVHNGNPGLVSWPDYFLTFNEFLPSMPRREVQFTPTCNFMITKAAFQNGGGFREDIIAGEDTLFCYAAGKNYPLLFEPALQVAHCNRERWNLFMAHHRCFGEHSAYVRKQADIPGKSLVRNPLLAMLAPLIRTLRISGRMLRYNPRHLPVFMVSSPLLFCGTVAWSYGFMKEAWKRRV